MKRKFTFLIAAAVMLLTMMASTGTMWGQSTYTKVTTAQSDWTGTYVIVADASNVIFTGQSGSNNYGGYAAVTISNSSVTGDFSNYEVEIEKSGDYYTMKHSSSTKYLGWTSGNYLYFSTSTPTANSYKWSLSTSAILNASDTNRKLQYNSGSPRFACYTSSQKVAYLYKKETGGDAPTITADPVSIGYNETSGSITYTIDPSTGASITNAVVTTSNPAGWLTVSSPFTSPIALTCEANATPSAKTAIVTLTCTYGSNQTTTKTVSVTQEGNPNASGGANNPYSVAEAFAAIDAGTGITGVYATGIVSQVDSYNNNYHSITYWISDNGTTTDQLEAYGGISGIDGWTFSSVEDIAVGATVVIHGNLKKFNTTYEFDLNNELVSYTAPAVVIATPTFSPEAGTYTEVQTVTISCETTGVSIYYTTDGSNPDKTSTLYNGAITVSETKTIKAIAYDSNNNHSPVASSTYTINLPYIGDPYARVDNVSYLTNGVRVIFAARFDENAVQYYAMSNTASGKPTGVPFTSTTSNTFEVLPGSILNSENSYYWTVGVTTDGYTFTNANGDVLGWTSSTNFTIGGDNTLWTVESGTSGESAMVPNHTAFNIVNVGSTGTNTTRGIALNNQYNFGPYAMSNNNSPDYNLSIDIFVQGAEPVATPSITAANVDIEYSVTNGNITYTINNEPNPAGTLTAAVKEGTTPTIANFSLSTVTDEAVPFTCDANDTGVIRTATVTLTYTYGNDQTVTKDVVVTQTAAPVIYTTIPQIFAAATSTETNVNVTFGNWVVSGVTSDNKTAYVTDNLGNGFIIYTSNNDFAVNDKLGGTVNETPLKLFKGAAEFTNLTASTSGLTVTNDGEITILTDKTIADLGGVNTGAVITLSNLTYDGTNLSDGTNTIKPFATLYSGTFESGKTYNVTGVYLQYDSTKEILPRSADDIEEVVITTASITVSPDEINVDANENDGTLAITVSNMTIDDPNADLGIQFYDGNGTEIENPDWIVFDDFEVSGENYTIYYMIGENEGAYRQAFLKVYGMDANTEFIYSNLVSINQAAPVTPPTGDEYDLYSGDLVEGDYIIYYDGSAMKNTVDNGRLYYETVSPENGAIISDDASIVWHIAPNGEYWTIYNADVQKYAAGTGVKNKAQLLDDGDDDKSLWTVSGTETYDFVNKANAAANVNAYLRNNVSGGTNYGFACYASGTGGALSLYKKVDPSAATIAVSPSTVNAPAAATNGTLTVTYHNINMNTVDIQWTSEEPNWVTLTFDNNNNVEYTISENIDTEARTVSFKVTGQNDNTNEDVYSNEITINQAGYVIDYAELPFPFTGGKDDIENTVGLTQEYLGTDYTNVTTKLRFDNKNNNSTLVLKLNQAPASISYDIVGNGFSGSTFKVQVSANGTDYDDLEVYTELGATQTITLINYDDDVRYVRWIYFKNSGNVGLGNIYVSDAYDIYGDVTFSNLDLTASSQSLIIHDGSVVTVTGTLTNNSPDNLLIHDGGQLYHNNSVAASMEKTIEGVTNWHNENDHGGGWYLLSSPIGMQSAYGLETVVNLAPEAVAGVPQFDLFTYNEPNVQWMNFNHNSYAVYKGQGFLYARHEGATLKFSGTLPVANTELSPSSNPKLEYTEANGDMAGWNLIGNPYSHNITWNNFTSTDDINTSGYYRMVDGAWITEASKTAEIKPMEGFLVKATGDNPYIMIKNTPSSKDNTDNDFVEFIVNSANHYDVTYAMFSEGEGLEKISHRNTDIPMVYIPKDGERYAIATMGDNTKAFNLNFKAMTTGQYTLKMKANSEYSYLHVIDRLTGEDVDMLLNGEYTFIGSPRDDENRFIVRLNANSNFGADNDIFAYQNGSEIIVSGEGELQIFDVMGRFVMSRTINGNESINTATFNTGVYVLRMVGETVKTQKIVVK